MSPVNRAGSVSEISPRHSFLRENMRGRAGPVTEISVTGMKFSHMNTPACSVVPYSYPVAITTVSKRNRSGLSAARGELWE